MQGFAVDIFGKKYQTRRLVCNDYLYNMLLGAMWGSVIFGRIFDVNCLLWKEVCSKRASCLLYDTHRLAYTLATFCK